MGYKNVNDAMYIIKFVVRDEGIDYFNDWYNNKHLKWAADLFKCKSAIRLESTHSPYCTHTYYAIYTFDSKEDMDIGLTMTPARDELVEDLKKIREYVVEEEFMPTFEILTYFPDS